MFHMFWWDPHYLLYIAPALLLGLWAQMRISMTYAAAARQPAPLSGAAAARHILDSAGLQDVAIEDIEKRCPEINHPSLCDLGCLADGDVLVSPTEGARSRQGSGLVAKSEGSRCGKGVRVEKRCGERIQISAI